MMSFIDVCDDSNYLVIVFDDSIVRNICDIMDVLDDCVFRYAYDVHVFPIVLDDCDIPDVLSIILFGGTFVQI
jgi:hypothetical protein